MWDKVLIEGRIQLFGTVAGPTRLYILPSSIYASILGDDYETSPVLSDAVVSDVEREVLIGDYLTGSLGIILGILGMVFGELMVVIPTVRPGGVINHSIGNALNTV